MGYLYRGSPVYGIPEGVPCIGVPYMGDPSMGCLLYAGALQGVPARGPIEWYTEEVPCGSRLCGFRCGSSMCWSRVGLLCGTHVGCLTKGFRFSGYPVGGPL